jgi:hypothetical protein
VIPRRLEILYADVIPDLRRSLEIIQQHFLLCAGRKACTQNAAQQRGTESEIRNPKSKVGQHTRVEEERPAPGSRRAESARKAS